MKKERSECNSVDSVDYYDLMRHSLLLFCQSIPVGIDYLRVRLCDSIF